MRTSSTGIATSAESTVGAFASTRTRVVIGAVRPTRAVGVRTPVHFGARVASRCAVVTVCAVCTCCTASFRLAVRATVTGRTTRTGARTSVAVGTIHAVRAVVAPRAIVTRSAIRATGTGDSLRAVCVACTVITLRAIAANAFGTLASGSAEIALSARVLFGAILCGACVRIGALGVNCATMNRGLEIACVVATVRIVTQPIVRTSEVREVEEKLRTVVHRQEIPRSDALSDNTRLLLP